MCDYCAWIEKLLRPPRLQASPTICANIPEKPETPVKYERTILVHGTADSMLSRDEINGILESVERAATEAYKELAKGCESVDAVELAIRRLENEETSANLDEIVDESKGNAGSSIRDAAIMSSDSNAGAVGAATGILHPITLAKRVMRNTDRVLIVENGAHKLVSRSSKNEKFDQAESVSDNHSPRRNKTETRQTGNFSEMTENCRRSYGALARDRKGRLACGVSTIDNREASIERSSVSAVGTVLGCGIFADEESCCSVSGEDRAIYVYAPARRIVERLKRERATRGDVEEVLRAEEALNDELTTFSKETGESCIGAATLRLHGEPKVAFTSRYFPWACCSNGIVTSGCIHDETFTKDVEGLDMPLDCECH